MAKRSTKKNPEANEPAATPEPQKTRAEANPALKPATVQLVGIGASAGGLEAIENFFSNMPSDTGMAFVIVQHLDPTGKSSMPEIMVRFTKMSVQVAKDGMAVEPDAIYLIPPRKYMGIRNGKLFFEEPPKSGLRLPIDFFFRSLSVEKGPEGIAVVLSGTGTDGTLGIRAIKAELGTVFAQDPQSAGYDGMPRSAIDTGLVDYILKAGEMPDKIISLVKQSGLNVEHPGMIDMEDQASYKQMFALLQARTGHDFSHYKQSTVRRRVHRRISVNDMNNIAAYVRFLRDDEEEVKALLKDLLISVTNFFRDPDVFKALEEELMKLLETRPQDSDFRVWVAGCATGEEAYSVAIIVAECLQKLGKRLQVQIYGTDIDMDALQVARSGSYPARIEADVSAERLKRYFFKNEDGYQIKKEIRSMMVFAPQNFIKDPPFSRLDLVCCRNLLIYLEGEIQKRLIPLLHYALKPGGLLVLGGSETVGEATDLFKILHKKEKIYLRRNTLVPADRLKFPPAFTPSLPGTTVETEGKRDEMQVPELAEKVFLDSYAPTFAVIDEKHRLVYVRGRTGKFLEIASGQPSLSVLEMAREGLRSALASAIHQATTTKQPVEVNGLRVKTNGDYQTINLVVAPLKEQRQLTGLTMLVFKEMGEPSTTAKSGHGSKGGKKAASDLETELKFTKENLQTTIEELEATNEELTSANEELQSNNEELQSTNEELDTSREEMQSLNEELTTVNAELQDSNEQLSKANDDLKNFLNRTDIAIMFLDQDLNVRSFTPATTEVFKIREIDIGRSIEEIATRLVYEDVLDDAREVLRTLQPCELEVQRKDGRWFNMRVLPYRTTDNTVEGLVLSFLDIDAQKTAAEELLDSNRKLENLAKFPQENPNPVMRIDGSGRIIFANHACDEIDLFKCDEDNLLPENYRSIVDRILKSGNAETIEVESQGKVFAANLVPVTEFGYVNLYGIDITGRKKAEQTISISEELAHQKAEDLEALMDVAPAAIWISNDPECRIIIGNKRANSFYEAAPEENVSAGSANGKQIDLTRRFFKDGRELKPEELPMQTAARENREVNNFEVNVETPSGKMITILGNAKPLRDKDGNVRGAVSVFIDITERKQTEEMKDEFIGMVSHELRTPLTVIIGSLATASVENVSPEDVNELLGSALENSKILGNMIDNLLELSRYQSRRLEMFTRKTDFGEVVEQVIRLLNDKYKGLPLTVEIPESLPRVLIDPLRTERVLFNLLDNAFKYSPDGGDVKVTARQEDDRIVISVTDHGIGIAEEDQPRLFDSFERLGVQLDKSIQGTGLGLRVSKILVEAQGGEIWVDSQKGKGSTFFFSLPVAGK